MRLDIKNLSVSYEKTEVLKNLSLCVREGEFYTILGHSGSGKSTILKAVAGLIESTGNINLGHEDISVLPAEKRDIAFVFQKPLLFPHLSVRKNISFGLEIHKWKKADIDKRVDELLELLFIKELGGRMPNELSGGQQQRVAIARSIALNPKIILMDEPFSSLDPELRRDLGSQLKSIQEKLRLTIIFVTHDPYEALLLSDTIAFLEDGEVLQEGTSEEIYNKPQSRVVGDFFGLGNYIVNKSEKNSPKTLFVRAHHIVVRELSAKVNSHSEVLLSKAKLLNMDRVGKECRLTFLSKDGTITVEYFGSDMYIKNQEYKLVVQQDKLHYL